MYKCILILLVSTVMLNPRVSCSLCPSSIIYLIFSHYTQTNIHTTYIHIYIHIVRLHSKRCPKKTHMKEHTHSTHIRNVSLKIVRIDSNTSVIPALCLKAVSSNSTKNTHTPCECIYIFICIYIYLSLGARSTHIYLFLRAAFTMKLNDQAIARCVLFYCCCCCCCSMCREPVYWVEKACEKPFIRKGLVTWTSTNYGWCISNERKRERKSKRKLE